MSSMFLIVMFWGLLTLSQIIKVPFQFFVPWSSKLLFLPCQFFPSFGKLKFNIIITKVLTFFASQNLAHTRFDSCLGYHKERKNSLKSFSCLMSWQGHVSRFKFLYIKRFDHNEAHWPLFKNTQTSWVWKRSQYEYMFWLIAFLE